MNAVVGAQNRLRVIRIDRLAQQRIVVFGIDIHVNGDNMNVEFFSFFKESAVVIIQIFTVLPTGLPAFALVLLQATKQSE